MTPVTIIIPHYKTLELTKLCLRLIRKYTPADLAHVIVVDNGSNDASSDYLRQLTWIELIERDTSQDASGVQSHSLALDEAMQRVKTPFALIIHTDTLVRRSGWLEYLLAQFDNQPNLAGVGSWKLEAKPWYRNWLKRIETYLQLTFYKLIGKRQHSIAGVGDNFYYLRSHLALYRTHLINQYQPIFYHKKYPAGWTIHRNLVDNGYDMLFLTSEQLGQYVDHVNHATVFLNKEFVTRSKRKGMKRIKKAMKSVNAGTILQDESLDR